MTTQHRLTLELLQQVPMLASVNEHGLRWLIDASRCERYAPSKKLLVELEPGDKILFILRGCARVTVGGHSGEPPVAIGKVGPGDAIGEVTVFTGEVRSASVEATEDMEVLSVSQAIFERLVERFPEVATHCAQTLCKRLVETEATIAQALGLTGDEETARIALKAVQEQGQRRLHVPLRRGISGLYHDLVKGRGHDRAFLMLVSFAAAVLLSRGVIGLVRQLGWATLDPLLRGTYLVGLVLLSGSALFAIEIHRRAVVRTLAMLFGAGLGLLLNGMSALIAFDVFYDPSWAPDPNRPFSIELLYDRGEGPLLLAVAAALLIQAAYLRRFYFRCVQFVLYRLRSRNAKPSA